MATQKQQISLSFKISKPMSTRIEKECALEQGRAFSDMAKILIAEALSIREGKRNIHKIL